MFKYLFDLLLSKLDIDGVIIDYWSEETKAYGTGSPTCKITFTTPASLRKLFLNFTLGFSEGYASGQILIEGSIERMWQIVLKNEQHFHTITFLEQLYPNNFNRKEYQKKMVQQHYDLGNDFFKLWLDENMVYSCAYYKNPSDSLEQAQLNKIDHLLRKLYLQPKQQLLDIGCGWGSLALRAAQLYDVQVLGITLSDEQYHYAREQAKALGLESKVRFELRNIQDMASYKGQFDRIVSVGMLVHVGKYNMPAFLKTIQQLVKPNGLVALHTITQKKEERMNSFIDEYIFPGAYIPSIRELIWEFPEYGFRLHDYENLGLHYAKTLREWLHRFETHSEEISQHYSEFFMRMWTLYLGCSAGSFASGALDLSQFVFSPINNFSPVSYPMTREFIYT